MAEFIEGTVQYDRWGEDIKDVCNKMLENAATTDPVTRYANLMDMFLETYNVKCLSTNFTHYIKQVKRKDVVSAAQTYRAWIYQTCTEYGYYQTSARKSSLFSKRITLDFYLSLCSRIFSSFFNKSFVDKAINQTNMFFGGLDIRVTRILFVHGSTDPWHALGVVAPSNRNENVDVVYVKGGSHCWDLRPPRLNESTKVKKARKKITDLLDLWLVE